MRHRHSGEILSRDTQHGS